MGNQLNVRSLSKGDNTNTEQMQTDIHAWSAIRTRDPSA
jgi:hypothetical protein